MDSMFQQTGTNKSDDFEFSKCTKIHRGNFMFMDYLYQFS